MTLQAGRLVIPPLVPVIIEEYAITEVGIGVALTAMWWLYAVFQFVSGRLSDVLTRETLLVAGMGLLGAGLLTMGGAPNFAVFLVGLLTIGVGAGLFPSAAYALISDMYVEKRGSALGIYTSGSDVGGVAAAGLAVPALAVGVWQGVFFPVAAAALVTALVLHRQRQEPYRLCRVSLDLRGSVTQLVSDRRVLLVLLAYSCYVVTWQGFTSFLPTYLQVEKSFSPTVASGSFAVVFVVGAVMKPVAGSLSDRTHRLDVGGGAMSLGVLALGSLVLVSGRALVLVAIVGFATGLMAFPPAMQSYLFDILPDDDRGRDFGTIRTTYLVVGSSGPALTGLVVHRLGYAVAFTALLASLAVTAGTVLWLRPRSR